MNLKKRLLENGSYKIETRDNKSHDIFILGSLVYHNVIKRIKRLRKSSHVGRISKTTCPTIELESRLY